MKLKTADEWMFEKGRTMPAELHLGERTLSSEVITILTKQDIEAIQIDALKFAAEELENAKGNNHDSVKFLIERFKQRILLTATKLEKGELSV